MEKIVKLEKDVKFFERYLPLIIIILAVCCLGCLCFCCRGRIEKCSKYQREANVVKFVRTPMEKIPAPSVISTEMHGMKNIDRDLHTDYERNESHFGGQTNGV